MLYVEASYFDKFCCACTGLQMQSCSCKGVSCILSMWWFTQTYLPLFLLLWMVIIASHNAVSTLDYVCIPTTNYSYDHVQLLPAFATQQQLELPLFCSCFTAVIALQMMQGPNVEAGTHIEEPCTSQTSSPTSLKEGSPEPWEELTSKSRAQYPNEELGTTFSGLKLGLDSRVPSSVTIRYDTHLLRRPFLFE